MSLKLKPSSASISPPLTFGYIDEAHIELSHGGIPEILINGFPRVALCHLNGHAKWSG
ncbi:MAG: hypothetical protein IBX72_16315 [Nitrospirae bacterium]|nr:hypothetical protein [Nitrospirota bacterium]